MPFQGFGARIISLCELFGMTIKAVICNNVKAYDTHEDLFHKCNVSCYFSLILQMGCKGMQTMGWSRKMGMWGGGRK